MINLPPDFILRTKELLGNEWNSFCEALNGQSPTSIRINSGKNGKFNIPDSEKVPWCERGFYLKNRPQFTFDPLFHAGCYYVQEASSMFIGHVLKQYVNEDVKILDLCAAPGGKSTLIADHISKGSLLVSNEVIRPRANILAENITKWGYPNMVVTNNDPAKIGRLHGFFDVILVDAPCSGEGMFRKDEKAIEEWSVDNVRLCKERQQRILADIWPALKTGGLLLYGTCTYNKEENEENVQWVRDELGADVLPVVVEEEWGITSSFSEGLSAYRFFPHKVKGEGFFFALLRKTAEVDIVHSRRKKQKGKNSPKEVLNPQYKEYLLNNDQFSFYPKNDKWYAFPLLLSKELPLLSSTLNIISEGVCLGEFKGKDFVPCHSLAMSNSLNRESFDIYEIDWQTAINYLRREPLILEKASSGFVLLTYKDQPLGFVKNIGNRANNLYPQEWRIRSSRIPDDLVDILG